MTADESQLDQVLAIEMDGEESPVGYPYLSERAEDFVRSRTITDSDALIRYVFGSSADTTLWRPLLRTVLETSRCLEELSDGAWRIRSEGVQDFPEATFVVLDVETTGLGAHRNRIIEIGLVKYCQGKEIARFASQCQPNRRIPSYIVTLTGITDEDLKTAPHFAEIAGEVLEFIGDLPIAGHNVSFDIAFLTAELRRIGQVPLGNLTLDTMGLAMRLMKQVKRPSLDKLATAVGLEPRKLHRAIDDADLTARVLMKLLAMATEQGAISVQDVVSLAAMPQRPPKDGIGRGRALLDRSHLDDLPRTPGVYIMRDANDDVIYVGKAKCIKDRVRSYYSQPLGYTRKLDGLLESIQKIETTETGSELAALLLESQLIRWHQPRYNTAQRSSEEYPYVRVDVANPWPRVTTSKSRKEDGARYFGPFRSNKTGRLIVELLNAVYPLRTCPRSFRNARSYGSPCLRLDLGQCLGPCVATTDRETYMSVVADVIRFLEGDDDVLINQIQAQLESAAERLDFEKARVLRQQMRTAQIVVDASRELREVRQSGVVLLLTPSGASSARRLTIVVDGQRWSEHDIEPGRDRRPVKQIAASLARCQTSGVAVIDHASIDDTLILRRWCAKHAGAPFIRKFASIDEINLAEVVRWARAINDDDLDPDAHIRHLQAIEMSVDAAMSP